MAIEVELQIATDTQTLPHPSQFREWVHAVLSDQLEDAELTIRIVDEAESAEMNHRYRHKSGPTNILSFPYQKQKGIYTVLLGDIIICAPLVEKEIQVKNKDLLSYWAHLVVHGTLHLLGYDHKTPQQAQTMETLETDILATLNLPPPYGA